MGPGSQTSWDTSLKKIARVNPDPRHVSDLCRLQNVNGHKMQASAEESPRRGWDAERGTQRGYSKTPERSDPLSGFESEGEEGQFSDMFDNENVQKGREERPKQVGSGARLSTRSCQQRRHSD